MGNACYVYKLAGNGGHGAECVFLHNGKFIVKATQCIPLTLKTCDEACGGKALHSITALSGIAVSALFERLSLARG